jgi:copper(I)-binding protein
MTVAMFAKSLAVAVGLLIAVGAWAQSGSVQVKDAWARATPGKAQTGAAYFTVESATPDRLVAVSTPAADKAELHNMTTEGGVMKMRPLAGIDLPAGQAVTLKPGGTHVMLMGLKAPLQAGQSVPMTLTFEKSGKREITVTVETAGAMGPEDKSGAGMQMPMPEKH